MRSVHARLIAAALAGLLVSAATSVAQDVTEPSLKSAFIYNIATFTVWPSQTLPGNAPFIACVVGDSAVGSALERTVRGRMLAGRPVTVVRVPNEGAVPMCHLLYVSDVNVERGRQIVEALRGTPVLTIVEIEGFAMPGSVARMFVERARLRFEIDYGLAKYSGLQLSSKLLALASRVHDGSVQVSR